MSRLRSRMLMMEPMANAVSINDIAAYSPYAWLNAMSYAGAADSLVTTHANAGSLGGDFTNAGGTVRPTYRATGLSGKPSFQFDGGDYFQLASVEMTTFTFITLFSSTSVDYGWLYEHGNDAATENATFLNVHNGYTALVRRSRGALSDGASAYNSSSGWGNTGSPIIARHVCTGTHASHKLYVDGVDSAWAAESGVDTLAACQSVTYTLNVASRNAASIFLTGHIAQLLLFTPALSDANAAAVEAILTSVYGL